MHCLDAGDGGISVEEKDDDTLQRDEIGHVSQIVLLHADPEQRGAHRPHLMAPNQRVAL